MPKDPSAANLVAGNAIRATFLSPPNYQNPNAQAPPSPHQTTPRNMQKPRQNAKNWQEPGRIRPKSENHFRQKNRFQIFSRRSRCSRPAAEKTILFRPGGPACQGPDQLKAAPGGAFSPKTAEIDRENIYFRYSNHECACVA